MPMTQTKQIPAPQMRETGRLYIAGMRRFFSYEDRGGIPSLWQRFAPHIGNIPGETEGQSYGICICSPSAEDEGFDYLSGVAVRSLDDLPEDLVGVRVPAQRWAVYPHEDHVSTLGGTCAAAGEWLAREGHKPAEGAVQMIEYYGPQFDPRTGSGGCEIWMPLNG